MHMCLVFLTGGHGSPAPLWSGCNLLVVTGAFSAFSCVGWCRCARQHSGCVAQSGSSTSHSRSILACAACQLSRGCAMCRVLVTKVLCYVRCAGYQGIVLCTMCWLSRHCTMYNVLVPVLSQHIFRSYLHRLPTGHGMMLACHFYDDFALLRKQTQIAS